MSRNKRYGPWSMSAVHECRLNAFWKRRFAALGVEQARPSGRQLACGVLLLGLLLAMPSLQLSPRQAGAEEHPVDKLPVTVALPSESPSTRSRPLPALDAPSSVLRPVGEVPPLPAVPRRWQLVDDPQLGTPSARIALMVGEQRQISLPPAGKVSSTAPDVFSAVKHPAGGNVTIRARASGVGIFKMEFDDRDDLEMQVVVVVDPSPLKAKLRQVGLDAIRVTPTIQGVILSGQVATATELNRCMGVADELFPLVVNNMQLSGGGQVMLHCKVFEFVTDEAAATETLQRLFDQQMEEPAGGIRTALLDGSAFDTTIDTLRKSGDVRLLAEPVLTTLSGRPAAFNAGGEFPILVPLGSGQPKNSVSVEYRRFGTTVQFVPTIMENGRLRLNVRPEVSQLETNKNSIVVEGATIPRLRTRWVDTSAEMDVEQTMVVAMIHEAGKGKHKCFVTMVRPSLVVSTAVAAEDVPTTRR